MYTCTYQIKSLTLVKLIYARQQAMNKTPGYCRYESLLFSNLIINLYTQVFTVARQNENT